MADIDNPTSVVRDHVLYLTAADCMQANPDTQPFYTYKGRAQPNNLATDSYLNLSIPNLPVGAVITRIDFYGYTQDNDSLICYFINRYDDITTGLAAHTLLDASDNLTGSAGDKNYTWEPGGGHTVTDKQPIVVWIKVRAEGIVNNAQFKGCKVQYTY